MYQAQAAPLLIFLLVIMAANASAHEDHRCPEGFPDTPMLPGHVEHADIVSGQSSFDQIRTAGRTLFVTQFNLCDGQGRPAATGAGEKRVPDQPDFIRTSAPDSNNCEGCHNLPATGGAGAFVANAFVLAEALDPVTESVSAQFSNERNPPGLFGAGAIEMLAREMTAELQAQARNLPNGVHVLSSKGVEFEVRIARGAVVQSKGIDRDLVIKPFHQSGVVVSLRQFAANAFNHHHGMQAEERFDLNPAKSLDPDYDEDGVTRELTLGDITAVTLWQAQLPVPQQVLPQNKAQRDVVARGERVFSELGCDSCHIPQLKLNNRHFVEPNPYNPAGTCSDTSLCPEIAFDLTSDGDRPRLERTPDGGAIVRAYTDLKRHNLCDPETHPDPIRHFCNEQLAQGRPDQDGRPGAEFFLTRKLWEVGSSAPYGHRGDLTTITEAILAHGGEARPTTEAFIDSSYEDQAVLVAFLKTLRAVNK